MIGDLEDRSKAFLDYILEYLPHIDFPKVEKALYFAIRAHHGQKRASGEDYASHPIAVAKILAELHLDTVCIVAGLLHDVLEDSDTSFEELQKLFGEKVASLVLALTKLHKLEGQSFLLKKSENLKRLLLAIAEDTRVLIVKLADRLHNMQTLSALSNPYKKIRIAQETMELYAPLADRIGLHFFKNQLYELAFEVLYPRIRKSVVQEIDNLKAKEYHDILTIVSEVANVMTRSKIRLEVKGREKTPFSIWQKMEKKRILFDNLSDIFAVRIITQNLQDCYKALGIIHSYYKVLSKEFFDYISTPKPNGYRSLHTVIFFSKNLRIEIQIRTQEMHYLSELGMSAHWIYKQKEGIISEKDKGIWLQKIRTIMEDLANNSDFLSQMQLNLDYDEVFCITPIGDIVNLQKGGNILDLAFEINKELGFHAVKALVNGLSVPLDYQVQNGDQVEIITEENISHENLHLAQTDKAKKIIQEFLDQASFNNLVISGNCTLQDQFAKYNLVPDKKELMIIAKDYNTNLDGLLFRIGKGLLEVDNVLSKISNLGLWHKTELMIKRLLQRKSEIPSFTLEETAEISISYCCELEANSLALGIYNTTTKVMILHSPYCNNIKINSQEQLYKIILPEEELFSQNKSLDITISDYKVSYEILKIISHFGLSHYESQVRLFGSDLMILTISLEGVIFYQLEGLVQEIRKQDKVLQVMVI